MLQLPFTPILWTRCYSYLLLMLHRDKGGLQSSQLLAQRSHITGLTPQLNLRLSLSCFSLLLACLQRNTAAMLSFEL